MARMPWFPFFPRDWLADGALAQCSPAARAAWIDLICYAHMGEFDRLGVFRVKGEPMSIAQLAKLVRAKPKVVHQLGCYQVLRLSSRTGTWYSARLLRDLRLRRLKARSGKRGGQANPKQTPRNPEAPASPRHQKADIRRQKNNTTNPEALEDCAAGQASDAGGGDVVAFLVEQGIEERRARNLAAISGATLDQVTIAVRNADHLRETGQLKNSRSAYIRAAISNGYDLLEGVRVADKRKRAEERAAVRQAAIDRRTAAQEQGERDARTLVAGLSDDEFDAALRAALPRLPANQRRWIETKPYLKDRANQRRCPEFVAAIHETLKGPTT